MKLSYLLLFIMVPALIMSSADAGTISGKVDMGKQRKKPKMKKRYGASEDKLFMPAPPRGAVVYLEGDFSGSNKTPPDVVYEMTQEGLQFVPSVLAVQVGSQVTFPNLDPVYHNVFSYTKDKRFDLGRFQKGEETPKVTFDKPGEVKIYCEIHSHMRSTIYVVDSPFYTVSDGNGEYSLSDIPPGEYTLKVWISSRKKFERKVVVTADSSELINFSK